LAIDLAKCEVFYPTRIENQQTHDMCVSLAREVATCLLLEVADPKKATSDYLSNGGGRFSWAVSSEDELPIELQDSLVITSKRKAPES
jgi:hypothetical protein